MEADFWHERWREGRIGFHQADVNKLLMKHWPRLVPEPSGDVFVPLCGKSLDMVWLAERGHHVIGVELSEIAVRDFFAERGWTPQVETHGAFTVSSANGVEIWCGDFFAFPKERLANVVGAFDRASLIALPADLRVAYARQLVALMPADAPTLLLTISYDQERMNGPPFSVTDAEVERLFGTLTAVRHMETRDAMGGSQNLAERGLDAVVTSVFVLGPSSGNTAEPSAGTV